MKEPQKLFNTSEPIYPDKIYHECPASYNNHTAKEMHIEPIYNDCTGEKESDELVELRTNANDVHEKFNKEVSRQNARAEMLVAIKSFATKIILLNQRLNKTDKKELKELLNEIIGVI